ncbi:hypothetical protein GCM10009122_54500 [Fulvivirga kasyanovii]|uniref:DNA-binding response regulator n=1 Tax=Fulvivirga kasyanovii TaxID=396812 RepID=A0ABW9RN03_9BACT|nr:response regulator transcription factor [Fulvivirga kasyanovii]MTI25366.1 DNA-binding response regulator [Fulvivirga kasyanovii]
MGNNRTTKIMLVEDKELICLQITERLKHLGSYEIVSYDTGEEAVRQYSEVKPDVVIMDIQLAGEMDGITTATLLQRKKKIPIIFLTDHTNREVHERLAYIDIVKFLPKPFRVDLLMMSLDKALEESAQNGSWVERDCVMINKGEGMQEKQNINDIIYLEAGGSYCTMYCIGTGKLSCFSKNMKVMHESIVKSASNPKKFIKIHKSYIVNIDHIKGRNGNQLIMLNEAVLPIGKKHKPEVDRIFNVI